MYVYAAAEVSAAVLPADAIPEGASPRLLNLGPNVSLVVSSVPSATYNAASLESRLSDLEWVSAAGAAHHRVVDALSESGLVVLPFRLFTVFSSDEQAVATVRKLGPALSRAFDRVRGREEWVLRVGKPDPARMEPKGKATAPTSGTSFLAAKAAAKREDAARAARVKADASASYDALQRLAEGATTKAVEPGGTLILDAAFLIAPSRVDALKQALTNAAAGLLRDGCPVSLTGPWPPYSFASVDTDADD